MGDGGVGAGVRVLCVGVWGGGVTGHPKYMCDTNLNEPRREVLAKSAVSHQKRVGTCVEAGSA